MAAGGKATVGGELLVVESLAPVVRGWLLRRVREEKVDGVAIDLRRIIGATAAAARHALQTGRTKTQREGGNAILAPVS